MADGEIGDWITAPDAAALAGVDPATIWRAAERGEIGFQKDGRNRKYKRDDVQRWATDRRAVHDRLTAVEADVIDLKARVERLERQQPPAD